MQGKAHSDSQCRIAVSSLGRTLNSKVGPLARCPYIFVFEGSPENYRVVESRPKGEAHERGPSAAQTLAKLNVGTVITGTIGPRAYKVLESAGIHVKGGCTGTVSSAVKKCAAGKLEDCKGATFAGHLSI